MKTPSFIFIFLISFASFSQQTDFTVAAGQQHTLLPDERTLSLKNLNLGDNCTIIIPPSMDGWTVTATDVTIGNNVKIIGMGANGRSALHYDNMGAAPNCRPGYLGQSGVAGMPGANGKNVSLTLRIRNIGSLMINVNGGNGGNGGNGSGGGKGGNATCTCDAGAGGNGGNGGNGGTGGNGGAVNVLYSAVGSVPVSNSNFLIQNSGGRSGGGGQPGAGGAGGITTCTDPKALVRKPGLPGKSGVAGSQVSPGQNGVTILQRQ